MKHTNPVFIVVDLFCGAGGTTTGFEMTNGIAKVIACVNHDPVAIKSHWRNHPHVKHFNEDIRTLDLYELKQIVDYYRKLYPNAKFILWASLECTNFSKAKGGMPRNADSRTLADHLDRYVIELNPDFVQIENVVEFMSWGPLTENGKPISKTAGSDWMKWRNRICAYGYNDEWKQANSADYGAFTSRNRLFGCFAKHGERIIWPTPTHSKNPSNNNLFGELKKWNPVREKLDFTKEGISIFNRKKNLSPKTMERIYHGLIKHIAGGKDSFISRYYSGNPEQRNSDLEHPLGVIRTNNCHSIIKASFITKYYSGAPEHKSSSVNTALGTIKTIDGNALIQASFIQKYYGTGITKSLSEPCDSITTKDRFGLVSAKYFLDKTYSGNSNHQSINEPAGTLMPNEKHRLIKAEPFIMPTNYNNQCKSIDEPCQVITANRKYHYLVNHYLVNPSFANNGSSIDKPCFTLIAKMDKKPPYLVSTERGEMVIEVYETDCYFTGKIKEFMSVYGIIDIKMRMLFVNELLQIQGFPADYILEGTQADQKKFIGNSVEPNFVKQWTIAKSSAYSPSVAA